MDWPNQCAVVIPCFNETRAIGELVASVRRYIPSVIVVDDGSTDTTSEKAATAGAEVIRHRINRGKGSALRSGWLRARERGFAWMLVMDGDGQHAPQDIPAFFTNANRTGAPLIIGDRMSHADTMPWVRQQVNRWMTRRLSRFVGAPLADSQCGFRLVNLNALFSLPLVADHFEIESEMLVAFFSAGHRVEFVPVQTIYKSTPSKIHPLVDTWRWLRWWGAQQRRRRVAEFEPATPVRVAG